jgi:hypothetical protein
LAEAILRLIWWPTGLCRQSGGQFESRYSFGHHTHFHYFMYIYLSYHSNLSFFVKIVKIYYIMYSYFYCIVCEINKSSKRSKKGLFWLQKRLVKLMLTKLMLTKFMITITVIATIIINMHEKVSKWVWFSTRIDVWINSWQDRWIQIMLFS